MKKSTKKNAGQIRPADGERKNRPDLKQYATDPAGPPQT